MPISLRHKSNKTSIKQPQTARQNTAPKNAPPPKDAPKGAPKDAKEAIGRIRGLEIEIASVILDMQEKVRQLELLNDFSSLMNSTLDTAQVREKALEATCQLLRCETASLLLIDTKTSELYWESALGETGKELQKSFRLPINDRSIAGYVAMTGEPLVLNDVQNDPRHFRPAKDLAQKSTQKSTKTSAHMSVKTSSKTPSFVTRTMICVPLFSKGQIIGVLQALNKLPSVPERETQFDWPSFSEDEKKQLQSLSHQVAIAIENSRLYSAIKKNFYETVEALVEAIEKKDRYTGGHTKRVVYYSMCIAKYMGLTPEVLERVRLGAILHDVGKIGIEDKILKKQAPLEKDEWQVMQTHPEIGFDIMNRVEGLRDVVGAMRYHHERWDGKGYPIGLKGEEIPMIARVVSVADTYDAMVSTRPYRKGLDPKIAYDEIVKHRGTQFDPAIVDAFIQAFQNEKMGKGSGGWSKSPQPSQAKDDEGFTSGFLSNCD